MAEIAVVAMLLLLPAALAAGWWERRRARRQEQMELARWRHPAYRHRRQWTEDQL